MPWYQFINNELDICDPDSYTILEKAPDTVDGPYLAAVFADEIPDDPERRPDLEGTPGLLFYIIRALAKGKGQPASDFPPVPLEVRMSAVPASGTPRQPDFLQENQQQQV
ncbi:hypothetical protein [Pedobacter hartonius]|uniref:Uncharacterized protein n=1 Tax=Pedobacter hartonius TaxID=425514 RepID=A0A1H4HDU5_9SPHI|nr:hypothetical protein [Pedobacter hartonius]SEB19846.1 hypothetical protein SAMN05443550_1163 [Pedobacter hartonius]